MPHSGHLKKIICENLLYRSLDDIVEFAFNFISDHKKELQLSDIFFLKKAGYVDIEDVLKKGIDELKKIIEKEDDFAEENKTILGTNNLKTDFQIVKFEKSFNSKDYLTEETLPKIISSVLLERMEEKVLIFKKKMVGLGAISRFSKNDYITLSEGDVINIKTSYEEERIPLLNRDMERLFKITFENFIRKSLNYNFTFLIELDPL